MVFVPSLPLSLSSRLILSAEWPATPPLHDAPQEPTSQYSQLALNFENATATGCD